MKHGRKLCKDEKIKLREDGKNPDNYLRVKKLTDKIIFVNIVTGELYDLYL